MAEMPAIKTPMDGDRKIGMSFNTSENRINGYSGCNNFFGSYVLNGSAVTFSQMGSTKMACIRNVIDEQAFLKKVSQAKKIILEDNLLKLLDDTNTVLAVFQHTPNDGMNTAETTED
jgi:heat shock protein HslJ